MFVLAILTDGLLAQLPVITGVGGSLTTGQNGAVRATVSGSNLTVTLRYGKGSQTVDEGYDAGMSFVAFGAWDAQIPASAVTHEGTWARVKAENSSGAVYFPSESGFIFLSVVMNEKDFDTIRAKGAYAGGLPSYTYILVSLPTGGILELPPLLGSQGKGQEGPTGWRLLSYTGSYVDASVLQGGKAYFFRNDTKKDPLAKLESGTFIGGDVLAQITLPAFQWSLVPWPRTLPATLSLDHSKVGSLWELGESGWVKTNRVKPFGAYAIYNKSASALSFKEVIASSTAKSSVIWSVQLKVTSGAHEDQDNEVGVCDALEVKQHEDPEPAGPADPLRLYFSDGVSDLPKASVYQPSGSSVYQWPFTVVSKHVDSDARLIVTKNGVPPSYVSCIVDIDNQSVFLDAAEIQCRLVGNNRFLLVVGSSDQVNEIIDEIKNRMPATLILGDAYPNPFNPMTTISFQLSRSETVTLDIYNTMGQKVRTLATGWMETGHHQTVWNGRDDRGRQVTSGIYFYRLIAGRATKTKKVLLLK